jgi:hypothetical protein
LRFKKEKKGSGTFFGTKSWGKRVAKSVRYISPFPRGSDHQHEIKRTEQVAKRQILAQGDRDGACLLYSLANGIQALTGKSVSPAAWTCAVDALPFATGEFLTRRGSAALDSYPQCLEALAREFMAGAGLDIVANWTSELDTPARLQAQLAPEGVLVMVVENNAHWVAVVDVSADQVFVACSWQALSGHFCKEKRSPNFGRWYNRCVSFADLQASGYGLSLTLSV